MDKNLPYRYVQEYNYYIFRFEDKNKFPYCYFPNSVMRQRFTNLLLDFSFHGHMVVAY